MKVMSTYCSKNKLKTNDKVFAIDLYQSNRIKRLHECSQKIGIKFAILSGKYGMLWPEDKVCYYDYKLEKSEVKDLSKKVEKWLIENKIKEVVWYTKSPEEDPNVEPYTECIQEICERARISLEIKFL